MRTTLAFLLLLTATVGALANTAPTPVVVSAAMRPGTTLMDVVYRVNDPDDATVKVRALAFINGTRSFANVIKPETFVEGTAANLGDTITTNTDHTLTWDVASDWNTDVGQLKFEVLALDQRGLLAFDWITIPAANGHPALTISKDTPGSSQLLDALFWQYASGTPDLSLANGVLSGTAQSGVFSGIALASGSSPQMYAPAYLFKCMNLDQATSAEITYAAVTAQSGLLSTSSRHAANRAYGGLNILVEWGFPNPIPLGLTSVTRIAAWSHCLALKDDGTVIAWGINTQGQATVPADLTGVTAIAAGGFHSLALKSDGTVVAWGYNVQGQCTVPTDLTGVTAIAAGGWHSLALKSNGTVVAWGSNNNYQCAVPDGLTGVIAIAAGSDHSLALKSDGTVVAWGSNGWGQTDIPSGLTGVTAIAAGERHSLALKSDGTVVAWGYDGNGQVSIPAGLSGVVAIAAGANHNLALKSDGTVTAWGANDQGQTNIPAGTTGVTSIAAGGTCSLAIKSETP